MTSVSVWLSSQIESRVWGGGGGRKDEREEGRDPNPWYQMGRIDTQFWMVADRLPDLCLRSLLHGACVSSKESIASGPAPNPRSTLTSGSFHTCLSLSSLFWKIKGEKVLEAPSRSRCRLWWNSGILGANAQALCMQDACRVLRGGWRLIKQGLCTLPPFLPSPSSLLLHPKFLIATSRPFFCPSLPPCPTPLPHRAPPARRLVLWLELTHHGSV